MQDLAILLEDRPGALADMGEALGRAGVSIEGGGAWVMNGRGIAHFLFADGHDQLILVVDDPVKARSVADAWEQERVAP